MLIILLSSGWQYPAFSFFLFYSVLLFACSFFFYSSSYRSKKIVEDSFFVSRSYRAYESSLVDINICPSLLLLTTVALRKLNVNAGNCCGGHFQVTQGCLSIISTATPLLFLCLVMITQSRATTSAQNAEQGLSIIVLGFSSQLLLLANNLFSLIIFLEMQAFSALYFMVTSSAVSFRERTYFKKNSLSGLQSEFPFFFVNSFIINYWASFCGTVLLVFSMFTLQNFLGFVDYESISTLWIAWKPSMHLLQTRVSEVVILSPIFIGFIIKLSFVPFHAWKPEVYKGLQYNVVFFLMVFYFFVLVSIVINTLFRDLFFLTFSWYVYTSLSLGAFVCFFLYSIFDVVHIKTFLAYGTIVHTAFILLSSCNFSYIV